MSAKDPEQKAKRSRSNPGPVWTFALIQTSKPAELEPLDGSHRRLMGVIAALNQLKRVAEYFTERGGIVTDDRQPTAPFGTIRSECPDDNMAAGAHGP